MHLLTKQNETTRAITISYCRATFYSNEDILSVFGYGRLSEWTAVARKGVVQWYALKWGHFFLMVILWFTNVVFAFADGQLLLSLLLFLIHFIMLFPWMYNKAIVKGERKMHRNKILFWLLLKWLNSFQTHYIYILIWTFNFDW